MQKIFLPPLGALRPEFREERDAWRDMLAVLGVDPQTEMHDKGCTCAEPACARLLAVRRYVGAHIAARRVRIGVQRLQAELTEFVDQYNAAEVDMAHDAAIAESFPSDYNTGAQQEDH
jgi:hypothetical protein